MRAFVLFAVMLSSSVLSIPLARTPDVVPMPAPTGPAGNRIDEVWFGGDDGNCIAFEGGVWDWDTGIPPSDTLQCWTVIDALGNPAIYFGHATADSFAAHGDPCEPVYDGGMLWCGIHEDEAVERDFVGGMGYQNRMQQYAFSPAFAVNPETATIDIEFLYFNDTEPNYDYTHVYLRCYDAGDELIEEYNIDSFTGVIGSFPSDPAHHAAEITPGTLPAETETIQLELRMLSDGGYSDEDGSYDSVCGPFGVDNVVIAVSDPPLEESAAYDFNDGPQGWTFAKGEGGGTYVSVVDEETWQEWVDAAGADCGGALDGNALAFVDRADSPYTPPGIPNHSHQVVVSGAVPRGEEDPGYWNGCRVEWDMFAWYPPLTCVSHRIGYSYYPYTTVVNPEPHWSPRMGKLFWNNVDPPVCGLFNHNFTTLDGGPGEPLPADWESVKVVFEVYCYCDLSGVDPEDWDVGNTHGSPVLDNVRVALFHDPDAPPICREPGAGFQDGFGQHYPEYLEPSDRGNADISLNVAPEGEDPQLGDSAVVRGPIVTGPETRYLVDLCFRLPRIGARQHWIPGYLQWKARLSGDPETEWVHALMDSVPQMWPGSYNDRFATYFHEDDPGFDPSHPHYSEAQEILPDDVLVPGTRIEYYYGSYWYNDGQPPVEYYELGPYEFDILPTMRPAEERDENPDYTVVWPSVLYIDAFNRGVEGLMDGALTQLGLEAYDRYDYMGSSGSWNAAPLKRMGDGNNGCTLRQLLGYRLIILNTGIFTSCIYEEDLDFLEEWLATTDCDILSIRRGIICDGVHIAAMIESLNPHLANEVLGMQYVGPYEGSTAECLDLGLPPPPYPPDPFVSLYRDDPDYGFSVVGTYPDAVGAFGSLVYIDDPDHYTEFAAVRRDNTTLANWRSVVTGFTFYRLCELGCGGMPPDSAETVQGVAEFLGREIDWILEGSGQPLQLWTYP